MNTIQANVMYLALIQPIACPIWGFLTQKNFAVKELRRFFFFLVLGNAFVLGLLACYMEKQHEIPVTFLISSESFSCLFEYTQRVFFHRRM